MSTFLSVLWDKIPGAIRWVILTILFIIWTPLKVREELILFIDSRAWAVIAPLKIETDSEITKMKTDLADLKDDVRDVKNYLLYKKRPEEDKGTDK